MGVHNVYFYECVSGLDSAFSYSCLKITNCEMDLGYSEHVANVRKQKELCNFFK